MAIIRGNKRKKNVPKRKTNSKSTPLRQRVLRWLGFGCLAFFGSTLLMVVAFRFINPPVTYLMIKRGFEWQSKGKGFKIDKNWVAYQDISDNLKRAAIAGEDAFFMTHNGFDTKSIKAALEKNQEGKHLRGGSTISQQVAKNVFLWPNRSWLRKGLEAYFTVLIEMVWSKKRILEVYLNVIEMGQGVYGAEAASYYYFRKSAKNLTRREAALIVAVLPNPRKWDPKRPSNYINRRANSIMRYLNHYTIPE